MQLSAFPKGFDRGRKVGYGIKQYSTTPSRGRQGTWVWIKDRYYIRTMGGTRLQALPKGISQIMKERLEQRNKRVRMVRYALILALVIGALVMLTGCEDSNPNNSTTSIQPFYQDTLNHVVCYSAYVYGGRSLSCVKLDAPGK